MDRLRCTRSLCSPQCFLLVPPPSPAPTGHLCPVPALAAAAGHQLHCSRGGRLRGLRLLPILRQPDHLLRL